jgi:hypothetical protein
VIHKEAIGRRLAISTSTKTPGETLNYYGRFVGGNIRKSRAAARQQS